MMIIRLSRRKPIHTLLQPRDNNAWEYFYDARKKIIDFLPILEVGPSYPAFTVQRKCANPEVSFFNYHQFSLLILSMNLYAHF